MSGKRGRCFTSGRRRSADEGMGAPTADILERAIEQKQQVTLSVSVDGTDFQFRARLVARTAPGEPAGVWAELIQGEKRPLNVAIDMRVPVEGSFMGTAARVCFSTCILARDKSHRLTERILVDALLLAKPATIDDSQQRADRRFMILDRSGITGRFFRSSGSSVRTKKYKDTAELTAKLWDLSRGGCSFVCPFDGRLLTIRGDEYLPVVISGQGVRAELAARHVYTRMLSGTSLRIGLRFVADSEQQAAALEEMRQLLDGWEQWVRGKRINVEAA
jgi:hypothetical protein